MACKYILLILQIMKDDFYFRDLYSFVEYADRLNMVWLNHLEGPRAFSLAVAESVDHLRLTG